MKLLLSILTACLMFSGCQYLDRLNEIELPEQEIITVQPENSQPVPEEIKTVPVEEVKPEIKPDKMAVDKWLTLDVSEWEETCKIQAYCLKDTLTIKAVDIPSNWPRFGECCATVGIIITIDGKRYASTFEFTKGEVKNFPCYKLGSGAEEAAGHLQGYSKLNGWHWKEGEEIEVFYIANNIRANQSKVKERSNVVKVVRK